MSYKLDSVAKGDAGFDMAAGSDGGRDPNDSVYRSNTFADTYQTQRFFCFRRVDIKTVAVIGYSQ